MKTINTIYAPVEKICNVTYYVWATPDVDGHFKPSPSFVLENRYFETREEAEAFLEEKKAKYWCDFEIRKKIEEL